AVADEVDRPDAGFYALGDFEDEVDAVAGELDDFGVNADVEAAAAAVEFDNARSVGLHDGARERAALFRLDFGLELFVLDLLVALEGDAVDDRIFDDGDGQPSALDRRTNLLEQTSGNKRLDTLIDLEGVEMAGRSRPEVGADGVGLDPLVALDDDGADRRRLSIGGPCRERHDPTTQKNRPKDEAGEAQPLNNPPTKFHPPRAPFFAPNNVAGATFGSRLPSLETAACSPACEQAVLKGRKTLRNSLLQMQNINGFRQISYRRAEFSRV